MKESATGAWAGRVVRRREDEVVSRRDGERVVILDTRCGRYLTLNETGGLLWSAMGQPIAATELVTLLTANYDVASDAASAAVAAFLDGLAVRNLLSVDEERG